jgi:hypothetical protein
MLELEPNNGEFHTDDLQFTLSEIQKNTLANNDVVASMEYTLKNQNTIKIPSNSNPISAGSQITFRFDKSYLSSNSYLNRCKMIGDIKTDISGSVGNLAANTYVASGTASAGQGSGTFYLPSLWNRMNSSLKPFILNKCLSTRDIDFSGKAIQSQTFSDPSELDEISCLFNQESLEKLGIYPEKKWGQTGLVSEVYGSYPKVSSWYDGAQSSVLAYGDSPKYLMEQPIYKRNTNGQYLRQKSNLFYKADGITLIGGYTYTYNGAGMITSTVQGTQAYVTIPFVGTFNPQIDLTVAGVAFAAGGAGTNAAVVQSIVWTVSEDMICDLFTNIYVDKPRYFAMNSSELNLRFSQSPIMNTFYETASRVGTGITGVTVSLTKLDLEFKTFSLGALQIPFRNFEIPFFVQTLNTQAAVLLSGVGVAQFPNIEYPVVPYYVKLDTYYPLSNVTGFSYLSNVLGISNITCSVGNDIGMAFQQMTMEDLQRRTMLNIGESAQNWDRCVKHLPIDNAPISVGSGTALPANYLIAKQGEQPDGVLSAAANLPFFLLKIGTDVRLPLGLEPGMRSPVNFQFTFNYIATAAPNAGSFTATAKIVAYTPSKYIISPRSGLVNTLSISYSRDEWLKHLGDANTSLEHLNPKYINNYVVPHGMVLGGSWFSSLAEHMGPILSGIKRAAMVVDRVSHAVKDYHPSIGVVNTISRGVHGTLSKMGYGKNGQISQYV